LSPASIKPRAEKIANSDLQHKPLKLSKFATATERQRALAQSLLISPALPYPPTAPPSNHPLVPNEENLIGFVTTGNFNLAVGHGIGVGSIFVSKIVGSDYKMKDRESRICIVRNVGESFGRLGLWEIV